MKFLFTKLDKKSFTVINLVLICILMKQKTIPMDRISKLVEDFQIINGYNILIAFLEIALN